MTGVLTGVDQLDPDLIATPPATQHLTGDSELLRIDPDIGDVAVVGIDHPASERLMPDHGNDRVAGEQSGPHAAKASSRYRQC